MDAGSLQRLLFHLPALSVTNANSTPNSIAPPHRGRILVVDDQRNMRTTTALVLTAEGYAVYQAATGQEALDFLGYTSVDVLLTDLKMEPMDGLSLLKKALEAVPQLQVIIMTAFGSIDSAVEAMRLGASDYITKPLKAGTLQHRVKLAMERARLLAEEKLRADKVHSRRNRKKPVGPRSPKTSKKKQAQRPRRPHGKS
jgi:two-component system response regulator HydG